MTQSAMALDVPVEEKPVKPKKIKKNAEQNKLSAEDRPAHEWYRFVLSYPPHLVQDYVRRFGLTSEQRVLDPFCGTGTTVVECKKLGIPSVGIEANPLAHFAGQVKLDWTIDPDALVAHSRAIAADALAILERDGINDEPLFESWPDEDKAAALRNVDAETAKLLLKDSVSPLPMHKVIVLREVLHRRRDEPYFDHQLLAFGTALTFQISNLHFGPEVGVGKPKPDAPVVSTWLARVEQMAEDLRQLQSLPTRATPAMIHCADARQLLRVIEPHSIDAVITSPPYPNEKDYSRTTRLEAVMLGFITTKEELKAVKRDLLRSNTRGVYKGDDDDEWVANHVEIQRLAAEIEARRIELNKTSGFERLYAKVTKLYFGGMAKHLAELRTVLRPGAQLAYVIGDQASYLRVMIRTGELLATIAEALGYEVVRIDLFRTRIATATREQLREEVLVLRWNGEQ